MDECLAASLANKFRLILYSILLTEFCKEPTCANQKKLNLANGILCNSISYFFALLSSYASKSIRNARTS
jgi:hypothetical protein